MLRTREEWYEFCIERGTSGDQVFDILKDWKESEKLDWVFDAANEIAELVRVNPGRDAQDYAGIIARHYGKRGNQK